MNNLSQAARFAIILVGAVILGYFLLGVVRTGGHQAGNVAGSLQKKID